MQKKLNKTSRRDAKRAALVKHTAEITGVSTRTVQRILNGDTKMTGRNEEVFAVFMDLSEGTNNLLAAVKKSVRFDVLTKKQIA